MERFSNLKITRLTIRQSLHLGRYRCRVNLERCPKMDLLGRMHRVTVPPPPPTPPPRNIIIKVEGGVNLEDRRSVPGSRTPSPMPSTSRAAAATAPRSFPGRDVKPVVPPKDSRRARPVTAAVQVQRNQGRKGSCECLICEKILASWSHLEVHMRGHTEERPYDCSICQKSFTTPSHLKTHRNAVHSEEQKRFRCGNCGKRFHHRQALMVHTRRHRREKPFPCGVCNKAFTTTFERNQHQTIHSSERPCPCDRCGKRFRVKAQLFEHIRRRHIRSRPHKCPVCQKGFVTPRDLKLHKVTHLPASRRPFKCVQCPRRFCAPGNLRDHQNIHAGRKPYSCLTCKQSFHSISARWLHCKNKGHRRAKTPGTAVKHEVINN